MPVLKASRHKYPLPKVYFGVPAMDDLGYSRSDCIEDKVWVPVIGTQTFVMYVAHTPESKICLSNKYYFIG